jgi:hypothetical protein
MLVIPPPHRPRKYGKPHLLSGSPVIPTVTVSTDAASYVLESGATMTASIADSGVPSTTRYTVEVSYNSPTPDSGTWYPGPTTLLLGDTVLHLMGQLPFSRISPHCRLRAVNNDTGAAGVSNAFALTAG